MGRYVSLNIVGRSSNYPKFWRSELNHVFVSKTEPIPNRFRSFWEETEPNWTKSQKSVPRTCNQVPPKQSVVCCVCTTPQQTVTAPRRQVYQTSQSPSLSRMLSYKEHLQKTASFGPPKSTTQTANRSVQPFLNSSRRCRRACPGMSFPLITAPSHGDLGSIRYMLPRAHSSQQNVVRYVVALPVKIAHLICGSLGRPNF